MRKDALQSDRAGHYQNISGCGNTTRCARPSVRALVLKSLRYWSECMGVDGFRFDLLDTSHASPDDIAETDHEWALELLDYDVAPRSVVVLENT